MLTLSPRDVILDENEEPFVPRQRGAAIFPFPGNATRALIMSLLQEQGHKVLVEVDDNYLIRAPQLPGTVHEWTQRIEKGGLDNHSSEAHTKIARFADGVIVSTPQLAREYEAVNEHVYVCPNSVDPEDWDFKREDEDVFRVGYAGSASHRYDFALIERALSWAEAQPGVEVVVMGVKLPGSRFTVAPWTDTLSDYRKSLFGLDVGFCPLKPNRWSNCKSDVKAMEYSMAGALPVFSREEPYRPWFDRNGIGCSTEKDFLKAVKWCVKNRDEVRAKSAEAKRYVLAERTIAKSIDKWREAIS